MSDDNTTSSGAFSHEPGLGPLLAQLFRDAESLLLQELSLLRAEIGDNAAHLIGGALAILAGLTVCLVGMLALVAAVIMVLGKLMPIWLAACLVGATIVAAGALLALWGRRRLARAKLVPRHTWQSLRETGEWLKEELT